MDRSRTKVRNSGRIISGMLLLLAVWVWAGDAAAKSYPQITVDGLPLTRQEEWVLEQTEAGKTADLLGRRPAAMREQKAMAWGPEVALQVMWDKLVKVNKQKEFLEGPGRNLTVRANFLARLLTNGFAGIKVHYHGMDLRNAIIDGPLDLRAADVPHDVKLRRCLLTDVDLRDSRFQKNLQILSSRILGDANFLRIKIDGCAYFNDSVFMEEANFNHAQIQGEFSAMNGLFNSVRKGVFFEDTLIKKNAFFQKAVFRSKATFQRAQIAGLLHMPEAVFHQEVSFEGLKVGQSLKFDGASFGGQANFRIINVGNFADFKRATFKGPALFGSAYVRRDFRAQEAKFAGAGSNDFASFFQLKVGHNAHFEKAVFQGPVDFNWLDIGLELHAEGAAFEHEDFGLEAGNMKVGSRVILEDATFQGPVNLGGSNIGGQLLASRASFLTKNEVIFDGLKVSQVAEFTDAMFNGPVNFKEAKIGGNLLADVKKQGAVLEGVGLRGRVLLNDGQFFDLSIKGREDHLPPIAELNLERTVVERDMVIENAKISRLKARNLQGKGKTTLENVTIADEADFRDSRFLNLKMIRCNWCREAEKIQLSGLNYEYLDIAENRNKPGEWKKLIDWVAHSSFDSRNYLKLRSYFLQNGQESLGDEVFIKMKRQEDWLELPRLWPWGWLDLDVLWEWFSWLMKKIFWDWLAGYGRHPLRIIMPALVIVGLGAWCYDPRDLKGVNWPKKKFRTLGRVLLSLEQFIPMVDLGLRKRWEPEKISKNLATFIYLQRLSGWILIPIFLTAIYSKFK